MDTHTTTQPTCTAPSLTVVSLPMATADPRWNMERYLRDVRRYNQSNIHALNLEGTPPLASTAHIRDIRSQLTSSYNPLPAEEEISVTRATPNPSFRPP